RLRDRGDPGSPPRVGVTGCVRAGGRTRPGLVHRPPHPDGREYPPLTEPVLALHSTSVLSGDRGPGGGGDVGPLGKRTSFPTRHVAPMFGWTCVSRARPDL